MKILIWTGYSGNVFKGMEKIDGSRSAQDVGWGSEGSLYRLALGLHELGHEVYIYGDLNLELGGYNINDYDAVIVQRFLNFILYQTSNHPNVILWLHDVVALPWLNGGQIPNQGKYLYENAANKGMFRKSVVLTPFHERKIRQHYDLPEDHFHIIGHGIDQEVDTSDTDKKIPFRMIWTSDWVRGLKKTIQILNNIPHEEVSISLEIYGEGAEGDMYIYLSDKGSKDFIKRLVEQKNFFLFTRSYWGDDIKEDYYDEDDANYYYFNTDFRRKEEPNGNILLNIDPEFNFNWNEEGVENGYDLILKQYLGLDKRFINWDKLPWVK